jgi:hypothetical protein
MFLVSFEINPKYLKSVLVNSAGVMYYCLTKNGYTDEWKRTIDVNVTGTTNVVGEVVPQMIKQNSGHIVNVSLFEFSVVKNAFIDYRLHLMLENVDLQDYPYILDPNFT